MNSDKKPARLRQISIKGARLHNLKNISVDVPHNKLTIITGVSGSGKSTLAFDTIYAEGQRRFVESLSSYARQFLERMGKPDVDSITGVPPAIAIEQRPPSRNPRSTVGTSTEIYDYLRLLFGRIGHTVCHKCGKHIKKDSPASVAEELSALEEGSKLYILFPLPDDTISIKDELDKLRGKGFFRFVTKGSDDIIDLETDKLPKNVCPADIAVLADRLIVRKDDESVSRLTDSLETAFKAGKGRISARNLNTGENIKFSTHYECAGCDILYYEPEPRLFSFNNPYGACPNCQGFGRTIGLDEDLIIPDDSLSLKKNSIHPYKGESYSKHHRALLRVAAARGIPIDEPIRSLNKEQKEFIWNGGGEYIGINKFFARLEEKNYKVQNRVMISRYRGYTTCRACGGSRLRTSARQVFINGHNIPQLVKMPLGIMLEYFQNLKLNEHEAELAGQVLREIIWRLNLLVEIGLEYLTLDRLTHTLSGGEAQRINLSTALGSSLVGTLYVLDEPSIGMHQRDTKRLLNILFKLRNLGNTIVVVEHDPDIIINADYIIDMGPKAGELGGEVVYEGSLKDINDSERSVTGQYLSGRKEIKIPDKRIKLNGKQITLTGPRENNLKIDEVSFPLGCMTVVTGVSGSGKSTLIHDVLYTSLKKLKGGFDGKAGAYDKIRGYELIENVQLVDQSPIGKSSRSTPATYTKAFDAIRELYASTQAAKQLGCKPGYFSFNVAGGRCEVCEGEGSVTVDMQFLPDVHLECEACKGTRYKREARNILYKGKSIVDVLNMTIDEAVEFFEGINKVTRKLSILQDVGLGYLRLGQPSTMLSGGESQRVKLANHLDSRIPDTFFIFDEPTTGLHLDDISKLLECFRRLVVMGHTVLIIEHNMHVIASADWLIDLGPEAGEDGGHIVCTGTPEQVAIVKESYTGKALKEFFKK